MKLNPQQVYKVHANYFIYNLFGPNANRRHKKFKAFFAYQNHLIIPPPKTKSPNWRVQPLLMSMKFLFPLIWLLGVAFSIDEKTMHFKGRHADKKGRCKKKKVMDYTHMLFVRKDTHIKYSCAIFFRQKHIYLKGGRVIKTKGIYQYGCTVRLK